MSALNGRNLALLTFSVFSCRILSAQTSVNCWSNGPNMEKCRIEQPSVSQRTSDCPQIRFRYGDRVRVVAGGCVQTGGGGKTWKRYVNPSGPDSDHLYFGLIRLPSFDVDFESDDQLNGFRRLSEVMGRSITVTTPPCDPKADCVTKYPGDDVGWLRLGYADDNYSDNGYWGHDDGTGDQCRGVGAAWIEIGIEGMWRDPAWRLESIGQVWTIPALTWHKRARMSVGLHACHRGSVERSHMSSQAYRASVHVVGSSLMCRHK
jgi:hypothetical protein